LVLEVCDNTDYSVLVTEKYEDPAATTTTNNNVNYDDDDESNDVGYDAKQKC
jgi:hypothetical protein